MLKKEDINALNWAKAGDLMPAIVQDACSGQVLMLGFMNREAVDKTLESGKVTFWSRTKRRLWKRPNIGSIWLTSAQTATGIRCSSSPIRTVRLVIAARRAASRRSSTAGTSCVNSRCSSKAAAAHHRKNPIRPVFMPRAPSALRRKSAKKA